MPISPSELLVAVGRQVHGVVRWGTPIPSGAPGVYVISLSADPSSMSGVMKEAPIDPVLVAGWIERVPTFQLDGEDEPSVAAVVACLKEFWLPDETVVYIGKATHLRSRLRQFVGHRLGDRKPHAGGHWLKTLSNLADLHLVYCECGTVDEAEQLENLAIESFCRQVSESSKSRLPNPSCPIPFANREYPQGTRKQRRIGRDVLRDV